MRLAAPRRRPRIGRNSDGVVVDQVPGMTNAPALAGAFFCLPLPASSCRSLDCPVAVSNYKILHPPLTKRDYSFPRCNECFSLAPAGLSGHHARDYLKHRRDAQTPWMPDPHRTACAGANTLVRSLPPIGIGERHKGRMECLLPPKRPAKPLRRSKDASNSWS